MIGLSHNLSQSQPSISNFKQFPKSNFFPGAPSTPTRKAVGEKEREFKCCCSGQNTHKKNLKQVFRVYLSSKTFFEPIRNHLNDQTHPSMCFLFLPDSQCLSAFSVCCSLFQGGITLENQNTSQGLLGTGIGTSLMTGMTPHTLQGQPQVLQIKGKHFSVHVRSIYVEMAKNILIGWHSALM